MVLKLYLNLIKDFSFLKWQLERASNTMNKLIIIIPATQNNHIRDGKAVNPIHQADASHTWHTKRSQYHTLKPATELASYPTLQATGYTQDS